MSTEPPGQAHTLDVYADYVPDRVDEAMERLDRMLGASPAGVATR